MGSERKCPICGETDPLPASICLAALTETAERGKPCQYSVEGQARTAAAIEAHAAEVMADVDAIRAARRSALPLTKEAADANR